MSGFDNLMLSFKKESEFLQTTSVFHRLSALSAPSMIEVYETIIWCIKFLDFDLCVVPEGGNWATGHVTEPVLGSSLDLVNTDGLGSRATFEREKEGDKIQVDEA